MPTSHPRSKPIVVLIFGAFSNLDSKELDLLEQASKLGDQLIVGVSTHDVYYKRHGKEAPDIKSYEHRSRLVRALKIVDGVFPEQGIYLKGDYINVFKADILAFSTEDNYEELKFDVTKGDQRFDFEIKYLTPTPSKPKPKPKFIKKQKLLF